MPAFLEKKLKKEYGADSSIPYKVMNSIGAMHGNKETAKGRAMERKHERDVGFDAYKKRREVAKKMGHNPHRREHHIKSQMKYFGSDKFSKDSKKANEGKEWEYARENRLSDKRIF